MQRPQLGRHLVYPPRKSGWPWVAVQYNGEGVCLAAVVDDLPKSKQDMAEIQVKQMLRSEVTMMDWQVRRELLEDMKEELRLSWPGRTDLGKACAVLEEFFNGEPIFNGKPPKES